MWKLGLITVLLVVTLCAGPVSAAFETAFQVWQPIETEEGIWLSTVTYVRYLTGIAPGYRVNFTCEANRVMTELGEFENRNAANQIGAKAWGDPFHVAHHSLLGDTVRVFVDLSAVQAKEVKGGWPVCAAVEATLECVLANACMDTTAFDPRIGRRTLKYVDLRIVGSADYAEWGRVYLVQDELSELPRKRMFQTCK